MPISNLSTRKNCPNEIFQMPIEVPHEFNYRLVNGDVTLQYLERKPKKIFPDQEGAITDRDEQWKHLIMQSSKSGRLLSKPAVFL
jgi:hypothetical protein